ncbi:hypothetical protein CHINAEXTREME_09640 [Halobiforma lacisalsi AJ5]|uniref:Uncharacterized protein n=1 Tax=Natronobacterium lacisalsi AJ5 TaxID=358396 RepID=M0L647_NATLA|nr:hypothetical protein [Halobiforma lacisalsi]APW98027.1 hypothetical protein CHINAEXTREME_09640 [Halobiforma lacisalsi AJ5]EMA28583.1 hypothetical protein C445_18201 [Halobiforma lacisalsi AJ5]
MTPARIHLEYYDKLLLAIVASLGFGMAIGLATSVAFLTGLAGGAVLATVFVYDAMFRNPPIPAGSARAKVAAVVWHAFLLVTVGAAVV